MARIYNAVRANGYTTGYYYLHVDMEETAYNVENNTSTILLTCRILGYAHSRDGFSGQAAWAGGPTKTLSLIWYDDNGEQEITQASGNFSQGGYVYPSGPDYGEPVLTKTITVQHKEDGTLSGYAKATMTGANSGYGPVNASVQTALTRLTDIPRASNMTIDDLLVIYGETSDNYNIAISKNVDTYVDVLKIKYKNVVLKEIDDVTDGDTIELTDTELEELWDNSTTDRFSDAQNPYYVLTYELTTYSDSTKETIIGISSKTARIYISGLTPSINTTSFTNSTSEISGLDNIIKGVSTVTQSATINLKAGSGILTATIGDGEAIISNNAISKTFENTSIVNYTIIVVDTRGLSTSQVITKTLVDYRDITLTNTRIARHTSTDGKLEILLNGNVKLGTLGTTTNALTIRYKIWETTGTEPSTWESICSQITSSTSDVTIDSLTGDYSCDYVTDALYNTNKIYTAKVEVSDKFTTYTGVATIGKGEPIFYWTKNKFVVLTDLYVGKSGGTSKIYLNGDEFKAEVIDNLTSTDTDKGLSANQGRVLNEKIDEKCPNYSTTEFKTGRKWIDGKDEYCRVISFTIIGWTSPEIEQTIATNVGIDTLISCDGSIVSGSVKFNLNAYAACRVLIINNNNIRFDTQDASFANKPCVIVLHYTKL